MWGEGSCIWSPSLPHSRQGLADGCCCHGSDCRGCLTQLPCLCWPCRHCIFAMANRGPAYGLSWEVQQRIDKQYDPELEQILTQWILAQCGGIQPPEPGKEKFQEWLKDGTVSIAGAEGSPCVPQQLGLSCMSCDIPSPPGSWSPRQFPLLDGAVRYKHPPGSLRGQHSSIDQGHLVLPAAP